MANEITQIPSLRPKKRHMLTESRALLELGATSFLLPLLLQAPRGDKHPVMVIPGFLASDISTKPLRTFLKMKRYSAVGWGLGRNLGTHIVGGKHIVSDELLNKVIELHVKHNSKVSLIGWSLGGILAREIARAIPDCIRQVISLGSPFNGPQGSAPLAAKMFEMINGDLSKREPDAVSRLIPPPTVPNSAIFSRSDGVAHWQACINNIEENHALSENIEVKGSHMGLGHNAQVLWIIANRLAQKQGQWQPFRDNTLHKILYPNPDRA
ncbi:lipase family protein [Aliiglaciecola lipolytica]|uniref:AB hydrolase-1 domain-containing protein n=1 Tax=Aliiglaciecola lipolytica E3 TaxID=1127673 RepID=K6Y940_9ALTE|nr:hypothetical protein [Aliiglaciecola lipolytica]GAC13183.1 hypothetical protein GLIP_0537 [Aliiglaciecola lipolytica E3]